MALKIGHACIDENGGIHGGISGDQTGKEVCTRTWYAGGWTVLLRPKNPVVAEKIAKACEAGCANNKIGYDQYQRNTLRTRAKAVSWDLSKITAACECDCSSFMAVCAEAAGINMDDTYTSGNAPTTSTMRAKFKATGAFDVLTDSKYLTSSAYLKRGDILVKEGTHTVMALSNGSDVATSSTGTTVVKYKVTTNGARLALRKAAGTNSDLIQYIPNGTVVTGTGKSQTVKNVKWLQVKVDGKTGWMHSGYLKKV